MTLSKIGRLLTALVASAALGLGMTACGGGTIGYLYVTGSFYNQISGFKIDNYTGNLTPINHAPFASGGTNPVTVLVKPGGRFVYVINSGSAVPGPTTAMQQIQAPGQSISVFSVGGDGILTFQQNYFTQGTQSVWATLDGSGNYLYVVDKYAPDYYQGTNSGSITAFSIASDTGRLTLVQNAAVLTGPTQNQPTNFFRVNSNPIMSKIGSSGCLFTINANTVFPYVVGSNGQLTVATTGSYQVGGSNVLTSINTSLGTSGGSYIYLTDGPGNQIFSVSSGTGCSLSPISGSQQTNVPGASNPVNSITASSGKFLYVVNQGTVINGVTASNSSTISAFNINGNGQLTTLGDPTSNPYAVGSGPTCVIQDPSNQYLFTSNNIDGTVTGKLINQANGFLSNLQRGSVFTTTQKPTCLAVSGNV